MKYLVCISVLVILAGCKVSPKDKFIGIWSVDIDQEILERNEWNYLMSNMMVFRADLSCRGLSFIDPITKEDINDKGTWSYSFKDSTDVIILDIPGNPINGEYKVLFYKDFENKLLKMRLYNSSTQFTCSKFLQNFERDGYDW